MTEYNNVLLDREKKLANALHLFLLIDTSSSMRNDGKIEALNNAICEAIPRMKYFQEKYINADIYIRAITFSTGARRHINQPMLSKEFYWDNLTAGGMTDMGQAFKLMTREFKQTNMRKFLLPPIIILISGDQPTDNWKFELEQMISTPIGEKSIRVAVGIENYANRIILKQFVGNGGSLVFMAKNADKLADELEEALIAGLINIYLEDIPGRFIKPNHTGRAYMVDNLLKKAS